VDDRQSKILQFASQAPQVFITSWLVFIKNIRRAAPAEGRSFRIDPSGSSHAEVHWFVLTITSDDILTIEFSLV
jgi:hypothetical protein